MTLPRNPTPEQILADLEPAQRRCLIDLANGRQAQATVTLLGLMGDRPALAIGRFPGPDELTDLGRAVAALAIETAGGSAVVGRRKILERIGSYARARLGKQQDP